MGTMIHSYQDILAIKLY